MPLHTLFKQGMRAAPPCLLVLLVFSLVHTGASTAAVATDPAKRSGAFIGYKEKVAKVACRDQDASCSDWAAKGECTSNPGFMKGSCPVACNECTPAEINAADFIGETLILSTKLGEIRVRMLYDNAPRSCALVLDLAHQGNCPHCNFYRVEAAPTDGTGGPPYGLLQGALAGILKSLPQEGKGLPVKYGNVATITGADFYIASMDHSDWGSAHTVWGHVENMDVVEIILKQTKFHEVKHPTFGTVMRMADEPLPFTPSYVREDEL